MKIRWGIAGLGNIAHRFADDLVNQATNAHLQAVASRDLERSNQFAARYRCKHAYGDYLSLVSDPSVDCIYVATIHPQHINIVELCLTHGKHVLVEKPAFTRGADWQAMEALAKSRNLLLLEAMKTVTFPAYRQLVSFLQTNQIRLTSVVASFSDIQPFDADSRLFKPELGGGALLDVGVYPLWLLFDLCRSTGMPIPKMSATLNKNYPEAKVEDHAEFLLSGDISGSINGSLSQGFPRHAVILGKDLEIIIHGKWWNPSTIDISYQGANTQISCPVRGGGFVYEIEHASELIIDGKTASNWIPATLSYDIISLMEQTLMDNDLE